MASTVQKEVSYIDWIFNNAGIIGSLAPVWEQEITEIHKVLDVNIFGMIHMLKSFMPLLFQQQRPAHIINMASLYSVCAGSQLAPYAMSKHAVLALSESLYFDLKRLQKSIDVSIVLPSFTDTSLLSPSQSNDASSFHHALNTLLAHSRPAIDVAAYIVQEVEQKKFYIFPDKEVKGYCEDRTHTMIEQNNPHLHNIEKLMLSLFKRSQKR
jgi:short-subunit dehydrogenase